MSCCSDNVPEFKFCLEDGLGDEFLPTRAHDTDAGWDVRAAEDVTLYDGEYKLISTGIKCFAPSGWWLELRPRSSCFGKLHLGTLYGVIDSTYEGTIYLAVRFNKDPSQDNKFINIKKGDRIGQLIPRKVQNMDMSIVSSDEFKKLCEERGGKRGAGGFGSSGI